MQLWFQATIGDLGSSNCKNLVTLLCQLQSGDEGIYMTMTVRLNCSLIVLPMSEARSELLYKWRRQERGLLH